MKDYIFVVFLSVLFNIIQVFYLVFAGKRQVKIHINS
jgi:hypothetical protein